MTAFYCRLGLIWDFFIDRKIKAGGKTFQRPHSSRHDMILSEVMWHHPFLCVRVCVCSVMARLWRKVLSAVCLVTVPERTAITHRHAETTEASGG